MKIAIMGIRGIPANYGGFETFIEEMAPRLVQRGHDVTVFGRSHFIRYEQESYKNVKIKLLPTIGHKYFDTVFHTWVCVLYSFFIKYDVVLLCNSANALSSVIPRLYGKPTVLNVDGLEWKRKKWNWIGKAFYRISEFFATILPNAIVTDAREVQQYYQKKFLKQSYYIPYGAPDRPLESKEILEKFGLKSRDYILYVSRLEPENNAHRVVSAFEKVKTRKKLVMVGDAPYSHEYKENLKKTRDPRIVFTGYVFGKGYKELQSHAFFYVQATEVGGTHPALLEGMGFGNCVLANHVPEHVEVLRDCGIYFSPNDDSDLTDKMQMLCDSPAQVKKYRQLVQQRVHGRFNWDAVTDDYERLFKKIVRVKDYKHE